MRASTALLVTGRLESPRLQQYRDGFGAVGRIYNDSKHRFRDGETIYTSLITSIDLEAGLIHTRNSVYKIG